MDKWKSILHLVSAGIFLFAMGWMSLFRFTKGPITEKRVKNNLVYKTCGIVVWGCVGILAIQFGIQEINSNFYVTKIDVFLLEKVAVIAFGTSWLIKGEAMTDLSEFGNKVLEMANTDKKR
ncbi:MAG: hypothetical protein ACI9DJ_000053 [Algoriphagus sp.]|jgi:hypothetical protein